MSDPRVERVQGLWRRIERWLATHCKGNPGLRPPVTEPELRAAEARLGFALPPDYRASLLVHDGQEPDGEVFGLPVDGRFVSLAAMLDQWENECDYAVDDDEGFEMFSDDAQRIRAVVFHPRRLVVAANADFDGDNTCLDLVPGPGGTEGQVLVSTSEFDFEVIGTSFADYLERLALCLEQGEYAVVDGAAHGCLEAIVRADQGDDGDDDALSGRKEAPLRRVRPL